jgi:uncharacterized protein YabE (DUF348 family)
MNNHPLIRLLVLLVIMGVIFFGVKHAMKDTLICTYKGTQMGCNTVHALEDLEILEKEMKTRAMSGEDLDKLQIELDFEIARIKTKYRIK